MWMCMWLASKPRPCMFVMNQSTICVLDFIVYDVCLSVYLSVYVTLYVCMYPLRFQVFEIKPRTSSIWQSLYLRAICIGHFSPPFWNRFSLNCISWHLPNSETKSGLGPLLLLHEASMSLELQAHITTAG